MMFFGLVREQENEIVALRAELQWAYSELISMATIYGHATTLEASRGKLARLEAVTAGGDDG